jgi:hypothetical protein
MSYRFLHLSAAQTILRADPDFWRLLEVYVWSVFIFIKIYLYMYYHLI